MKAKIVYDPTKDGTRDVPTQPQFVARYPLKEIKEMRTKMGKKNKKVKREQAKPVEATKPTEDTKPTTEALAAPEETTKTEKKPTEEKKAKPQQYTDEQYLNALKSAVEANKSQPATSRQISDALGIKDAEIGRALIRRAMAKLAEDKKVVIAKAPEGVKAGSVYSLPDSS